MVVEHIVLLKFKDESSEEDVQRFYDGINSLKVIPGVVSITVGKTFCESWMPDRRRGMNYTLTCRLESKEALKAYASNELHVKVRDECIVPLLAEPPMAIDYESEVVLGESAK